MKGQPARVPRYKQTAESQAAKELDTARRLLKELRVKLGEHPELEQAIQRVEMALNHLTLSTGGML